MVPPTGNAPVSQPLQGRANLSQLQRDNARLSTETERLRNHFVSNAESNTY